MKIPQFTGDKDKDEINPMEWLMMVKEYDMTPSRTKNCFSGESWNWWMSIDEDNNWKMSWEEFQELFLNKWIRDTKMEALYKIQEDLKEAKEEINKKSDELFKIRDLNEALVKEVQKLKQENTSKGKWGKYESREDLKKKYEEICRLRNHNKKILDKVNVLKEENMNYQNQEETKIVDE
jgi:hypothetical protein